MVLYYYAKISIDFLYRRKLQLKHFIRRQQILPSKLIRTYYLFIY